MPNRHPNSFPIAGNCGARNDARHTDSLAIAAADRLQNRWIRLRSRAKLQNEADRLFGGPLWCSAESIASDASLETPGAGRARRTRSTIRAPRDDDCQRCLAPASER